MEPLAGIFQALGQIVVALGDLVVNLLSLAMAWSLLIAWVAWWLLGVNWTKAWRALAQGAWAPIVLLMFISALVWSRIAPSECPCLGIVTIPNFWWQLGAVCLLAALTFFCGWIQGIMHWTPPEISVEPPAHAGHGHAHAHH